MKTEKDLLMYYHTGLRSVGLYTSLSLALLGYSRYFREQHEEHEDQEQNNLNSKKTKLSVKGLYGKVYEYENILNIAFIIISIIIMACANTICGYLLEDLKQMQNITKTTYITKWLIIPRYIFGINCLITSFGAYTLLKELNIL